MARVLLIDNRDSFTWNLEQAFRTLGADVVVRRGESIPLEELEEILPAPGGFTHVVVGPGPGSPARTAVGRRSLELSAGRIPWLGVCLGHQVLAESYGGTVAASGTPVHGKASPIEHRGSGIFRGCPQPLIAARYHSLAVVEKTLPDTLEVTAWTTGPGGERVVMGLGVPEAGIDGVQFHPESFMTPEGPRLLGNFLAGDRLRVLAGENRAGKDIDGRAASP